MKLAQFVARLFGFGAAWCVGAGLAAFTLGQWATGVWGCCIAVVAYQAHRSYNAQWRALRDG